MSLQIINVPVDFFKENGHFIAFCKPFDLVTQGNTLEEAQKRFQELIPVFIEDLKERGTLDEVLTELGWQRFHKVWSAPVKVAEITSEVKIPCPA